MFASKYPFLCEVIGNAKGWHDGAVYETGTEMKGLGSVCLNSLSVTLDPFGLEGKHFEIAENICGYLTKEGKGYLAKCDPKVFDSINMTYVSFIVELATARI